MSPGVDLIALLSGAVVLGILGSAHCATMCGGIACALGMSVERGGDRPRWHRGLCLVGYQLGRISSYSLAGAALGASAAAVASPLERHGAGPVLHLLQALLFVLLGLYLTGLWRAPLAAIERVGLALWTRLAPLRARLLPVRHPGQALAFGLLWGWMPCALVYSALVLAASGGSALAGAATMLAFGLGTVPSMLALSVLGRRLMGFAAQAWPRKLAGGVMLLAGAGMGVMSLVHVGH